MTTFRAGQHLSGSPGNRNDDGYHSTDGPEDGLTPPREDSSDSDSDNYVIDFSVNKKKTATEKHKSSALKNAANNEVRVNGCAKRLQLLETVTYSRHRL